MKFTAKLAPAQLHAAQHKHTTTHTEAIIYTATYIPGAGQESSSFIF